MNDSAHPDIVPVWRQVTVALQEELAAFWAMHGAITDPAQARVRAGQAVVVLRGADGRLCGVATAVRCVPPRLRQPMYFYRQFLAPAHRGQGLAVRVLHRARDVLQAWNAALPTPEAIGLLVEARQPTPGHGTAAVEEAGLTFIGYSPRGLPLRVAYFAGGRLLPPALSPARAGAPA